MILRPFKKSFLLIFSTIVLLLFTSCSTNSQFDEPIDSISGSTSLNSKEKMKWGKNEELYKVQIKSIAIELKNLTTAYLLAEPDTDPNGPTYSCSTVGGASFGYYNDSENLIVGGPYKSASTSSQETYFRTCSLVTSAIFSAKTYLLNEGYSDIVNTLDTPNERYKLIHAANALVDLKKVVNNSSVTNARLANCIFEALGFSALAELGANWAVASRQVIIRAVGKLATRYLGWFGAAIAVASFVDCYWIE